MKQHSLSCDQNREVILQVIEPLLQSCHKVLEIGSGTGQHAVYFAAHLPHLLWQSSDLPESHPSIQAWIADAQLTNVLAPLTLDVLQDPWPELVVDAVFSANSLHIMSWAAVEACFAGVGKLLKAGGLFVVYGPFNYDGRFTSESNARFDLWLKKRNPASGVRNFEDLNQLAQQAGMMLQEDYAMPVNNRILCWQKQ
ncbi:MAG: methylase [Proteobacteria bacterium]|nr:MAG: methylase [Pseudomonadota bacterium]